MHTCFWNSSAIFSASVFSFWKSSSCCLKNRWKKKGRYQQNELCSKHDIKLIYARTTSPCSHRRSTLAPFRSSSFSTVIFWLRFTFSSSSRPTSDLFGSETKWPSDHWRVNTKWDAIKKKHKNGFIYFITQQTQFYREGRLNPQTNQND